MTKICANCTRELPTTEFHKHCKCKDGLNSSCKDCRYNRWHGFPKSKSRNTDEESADCKLQRKLRVRYNNIIGNLLNGKTKVSDRFNFSSKELREHFEYYFNNQINWDTKEIFWRPEHIIPTSFFDLTDEQEIKICYDLSNLKPLCKIENVKKSDFLPNGDNARYYRKMGKDKFKFFSFDSLDPITINKFVIIKDVDSKFHGEKGQVIEIQDNLCIVKIFKTKGIIVEQLFNLSNLALIVLPNIQESNLTAAPNTVH